MEEISKLNGMDFSFNPNQIDIEMQIELDSTFQTWSELVAVFNRYKIEVNSLEEHIILRIMEEPKNKIVLPQFFTISGFVKDSSSSENLIGTSLAVIETGKGAISNSYGFFSIRMEEGDYELVFSFIGYNSLKKSISLHSDINLEIELSESSNEIEEVVIILVYMVM